MFHIIRVAQTPPLKNQGSLGNLEVVQEPKLEETASAFWNLRFLHRRMKINVDQSLWVRASSLGFQTGWAGPSTLSQTYYGWDFNPAVFCLL